MEKKILLVDNDKEFIEANKLLLEANGYCVNYALNGDEGFKKAKNELPDLMLLDVMMKYDSEGLDTAVNMKNDPKTKDIPVIMITGIRKAMHLPFSFEPNEEWPNIKSIMEKPVKPEELLKSVKSALA